MRIKDLASPAFSVAKKRIDAGVIDGEKRPNPDSSDFYDVHDSGLGEEKSIESEESKKS
jgi:hypothetical protein